MAAWLRADTGTLVINGDAGYGKSAFAASVVERVSVNVPVLTNVGYAFCLKLKLVTVLRSLLWQIVQHRNVTKEQRARIWEAHRDHRLRGGHGSPAQRERQEILDLCEVYAQILLRYESVTLVFDGVDQCDSPIDLLECISLIAASLLRFHKRIRLLFTSRLPPRLPKRIRDRMNCYSLKLTSDDVHNCAGKFIENSLTRLEIPMTDDAEALVRSMALAKAAEGWPYIMHSLATQYAESGRYREAEALEKQALDFIEARQRGTMGRSDPADELQLVAVSRSSLAEAGQSVTWSRSSLATHRS